MDPSRPYIHPCMGWICEVPQPGHRRGCEVPQPGHMTGCEVPQPGRIGGGLRGPVVDDLILAILVKQYKLAPDMLRQDNATKFSFVLSQL